MARKSWHSGQLCLAAVVVALLYAGYGYAGIGKRLKDAMHDAILFIESSEHAMMAYLAFTVVGVVALVPTTAMEFSGGFLFVPTYGLIGTLLFTCAAKFVANIIAVTLAKYVLRDFVKGLVERSEILSLVAESAKEEPYKMAFLVRGSYAPLSVKNYGLGALDIGYLPIMASSCIFSPFYAIQNIYMGSACKNLQEVFAPKSGGGSSGSSGWLHSLKAALPVLLNLLLVLFLLRAMKAQLKKSRSAMEARLKSKADRRDKTDKQS